MLPGCAPILGLSFSIGPSESLWSTPAWHIYIFFPNSYQFRSHCWLLRHLLGPLWFSDVTEHVSRDEESFLPESWIPNGKAVKLYSDPGFIIYQLHHLEDLTSPYTLPQVQKVNLSYSRSSRNKRYRKTKQTTTARLLTPLSCFLSQELPTIK